MSEEGTVDLQLGPIEPRRKPALPWSWVMINAMAAYEVANIDNSAVVEACRNAAREADVYEKYVKRVENEGVIKALEAALPKKRVQVPEPRDRKLLGRALAALHIRNATTDAQRGAIIELCNEIGINLEEFDELCNEFKLPDSPERNLEWRTKDGKSVKVCDIEDSHLKNLILFLERSAKVDQAGELLLVQALLNYRPKSLDMQLIQQAAQKEKPEPPAMYWVLRREAARRGMTLPPANVGDEVVGENKPKRAEAPAPGGRAFTFE